MLRTKHPPVPYTKEEGHRNLRVGSKGWGWGGSHHLPRANRPLKPAGAFYLVICHLYAKYYHAPSTHKPSPRASPAHANHASSTPGSPWNEMSTRNHCRTLPPTGYKTATHDSPLSLHSTTPIIQPRPSQATIRHRLTTCP